MKIGKNIAIASKPSMNLVLKEEKTVNPVKTALVAAGAVVVTLLVMKFGVLDRVNAVNDARESLNQTQDLYDALLMADKDYDNVVTEYNRYSFGAMTDEEKVVADRDKVLGLIEKYLINAASIEQVSLEGNSLSVQMSGVTLQQASDLLKTIQKDPLVAGVTVYTAGTNKEDETKGADKPATITITVTMKDNEVAGVDKSAESEETSEEGNTAGGGQ